MRFKTVVHVQALRNAPSVFSRHINRAAKKIEGRLIGDAIKETPEDEGTARRSFQGTHVVTGMRALIEVTNNAPHFAVLENGRGANKPAPPSGEGSLLYKWVVRKINPDKPKAVSFLIARSIGKNGLPGYQPMEKSFNKNKQFIQDSLDNAVADGVKQING